MTYTIIAMQTTSKRTVSVTVPGTPTGRYLAVSVPAGTLPEAGEYRYAVVRNPDELPVDISDFPSVVRLVDGDAAVQAAPVAQGLMMAGDMDNRDKTYGTQQIYEQYDG